MTDKKGVNYKGILTDKSLQEGKRGAAKLKRGKLTRRRTKKGRVCKQFAVAFSLRPSCLKAKIKTTMKEEVGKRLKECRLACKMTQRQVAQKLRVAQPVYQRYEAGIYECSYEQLASLCALFDVSADYLLGIKYF